MLLAFFASFSTYQEQDANILYSFDSAYQEIKIRKIIYNHKDTRIFHTNGAFSSGIYAADKTSPFQYIREIVDLTAKLQPKKVLVI
ncbi:MAG: hypothetical protein H6765_05145 [Candidatus Peribacteria bacterium]|nr:MAG: hypothetical protein H6765_05145 [Candidatus Peribacteria bacterium]